MVANKISVLVVDDYPDAASSLAILLRLHGFDVDFFETAEAAIAAFGKSTYHIVLLDLGLPGMSGYELARRIRDMQLRRKPVIIAVTGMSNVHDKPHKADIAIDRFLLKPVAPDELLVLLDQIKSQL